MDPFQTPVVDSSRLQALLSDYEARQSLEPVFNVAERLTFQSFRSVFRTGSIDPALLSAVMHTLAFAAAGGGINRECLGYQGRAFRFVRERMSSPRKATSESTIGAILLLAGVEARLRMTSQVQLHMGAVRLLLDISRTEGISLTGGIKRAIFWQDLNSSILAGSSRISHISSELLYELQRSNENPIWDSHLELLLWLLYSGGAFAPTGIARSSYITLLRLNDWRFGEMYKSWPELLGILEQFIWSEGAFMSQVKALWIETFA
ncbi:hypothetical protein GQX73_g8540 [Xylaria multiplex]|uniref:Transcription factor domain-containing protein n=1 Tax=Xylaria multiplex TaxID=323545 RepID=A0A7C8N2L1_9PEZI|nr:hypothetical protein GQX73_g8540 [Xylaria multiplex]